MPSDEVEADGAKDTLWAVLDIGWRILLVIVGVPAVWILRACGVVELSVWQAAVASAVLVALAAGDVLLAMTLVM